jgi:hypothetical protein
MLLSVLMERLRLKMKSETELLIELEKIRIRKIELSSKCRIKELLIKKEIAEIYRSKKQKNKIKKALEKEKKKDENN